MLAAGFCGWQIATARRLAPVRIVHWWIADVILPLLSTRSWWKRAGMIFINNITLLAILVFMGRFSGVATVGIAAIGLSMGIALRAMNESTGVFAGFPRTPGDRALRRIRIGMTLNMLEPPAIIAALGLAMGRMNYGIDPQQTWLLFSLWILPPMLIAAAGEALWMGEGLSPPTSGSSRSSSHQTQPNTNGPKDESQPPE